MKLVIAFVTALWLLATLFTFFYPTINSLWNRVVENINEKFKEEEKDGKIK